MPSRRHFICDVGGLAATGLAGCLDDDLAADVSPGDDPDTEWPQPGGRDRYDCYRSEAAAPRDSPSERWTADTFIPMARPIVADDRVLLFESSGLSAFDLSSGDSVWRIGGNDVDTDVRTAPLVVDGVAYVGVGSPDGVVAVDISDGKQLWHVELDGPPQVTPVVDYDRETLVVDTRGGFAGLDIDGERLWSRETFSGVATLSSWADGLYVGTAGGELLALYDLRDPKGLWRRQLDGKVEQVAILDGDGVVVSAFGGPLHRRDSDSAGSVRWSHDTGFQGFVTARNTYAVGTGFASIHTRTGERHWTLDLDLKAPPAGAGDTIYSGGEGFLAAYAMDGGTGVGDYRTGYERWRYDVEGEVNTGVSVADGAVFATAYDRDGGTLYALE